MDVYIEVKSFKTEDGSNALEISPSGTRRTMRSWYIWVKEDGSGLLVTKDTHLKLPANHKLSIKSL